MANYYALSTATFARDFHAALLDYYSEEGVNIVSASDTSIEFDCPAICDKTLKFTKTEAGFNAYCNGTHFSSAYSINVASGYNLVLSNAFAILDTLSGQYRNSAMVAKLTNGRFICTGGTVNTAASSYRVNNKCLFTDTMVLRPIRLLAPYSTNSVSSGKMCLFPSYLADDTEVELNDDGTFAYISGLYLTCTAGTPVVGGNYYLSQSGLVGTETEGYYCYTQKYVAIGEAPGSSDPAVTNERIARAVAAYLVDHPATGSTVRLSESTLTAANWVGTESPYSQVVTIPGVTAKSQVDLTPSAEQLSVFHNKDLALVAENDGGVVTVYAIGQKPENDYTIQVTITEVEV